MSNKKKVVLAFSGGLDTSVILKWLQVRGEWDVITFTADVGQGGEVRAAREKALQLGVQAQNIHIVDLKDEFVEDYVAPVFRANAAYEGIYLMGTPIARPLIARKQVELAERTGAVAVAHGATGKGNDQIRFELTYLAVAPDIQIVAPWREWDFKGRSDLVRFAQENGVPVAVEQDGGAKYSSDVNLVHATAEGRELEDPWHAPGPNAYTWVRSLQAAPDEPEIITLDFERGDPVAIDGDHLRPAVLLQRLNALGAKHGIGRIDIVDTRYLGIKSRGLFETPGGTIWQVAHRAMESITLDRGEAHLKDELMPRYAELIYNGYWHAPERALLQTLIDESQKYVSGQVRLQLYKGNVLVQGRRSQFSLYDAGLSSFETERGFHAADATGFIALNALRLRLLAKRSSGLAQAKKVGAHQ